jgi:regulator of nonsense transcripts 2
VKKWRASRHELRQRNLQAQASSGAPHGELRALDGSVKKNTAFVKKLRSAVTDAQGETLLADAAKLNLSKYLSEVATSLAQAGGVVKKASAETAAEVAQLLLRRHGADFAEPLKEAIEAQLSAVAVPSAEDREAVAAFRYTFQFYAELVLRGLLPEKEGRALCKRLAGLMAKDKDSLQLLPLVIALLRPVLGELAGMPPRQHRLMAEAHGVDIQPQPVFPELAEQVRSKGGERGTVTQTRDSEVEHHLIVLHHNMKP